MITKEQIETAIRTFTDDPVSNLELIVDAIAEADERSADMWVALQQCYSVFLSLANHMTDKRNRPLFDDAEKGAFMYANIHMAIDSIREVAEKYGGSNDA